MGDIGVGIREPTGLIDGRFRSRPKADVIDEADWERSLDYQPEPIGHDKWTNRTRFSTGVNAIPCTKPAPAPAKADRRVGCLGMICGPVRSVSSVISSSSSSSSSCGLS
jgi:hypothetical protein